MSVLCRLLVLTFSVISLWQWSQVRTDRKIRWRTSFVWSNWYLFHLFFNFSFYFSYGQTNIKLKLILWFYFLNWIFRRDTLIKTPWLISLLVCTSITTSMLHSSSWDSVSRYCILPFIIFIWCYCAATISSYFELFLLVIYDIVVVHSISLFLFFWNWALPPTPSFFSRSRATFCDCLCMTG